MKLYKCIKTFFCSPINRYIPEGSIVYKYENTSKISIQGAPQTDDDYTIKLDNFEFHGAEQVSWFYKSKIFDKFFEFIRDVPTEDIAGGGLQEAGNGHLMQIDVFILDAIDLFNGCVELSQQILIPSAVSLSVDGAPGQFIGVDFIVDIGTNSICWTGYKLESKLIVGDKMTVVYTA